MPHVEEIFFVSVLVAVAVSAKKLLSIYVFLPNKCLCARDGGRKGVGERLSALIRHNPLSHRTDRFRYFEGQCALKSSPD